LDNVSRKRIVEINSLDQNVKRSIKKEKKLKKLKNENDKNPKERKGSKV
jgi:hypothetical protein